MNKLVNGNLVRGLPSKPFKNDQTCVACQKGKKHRASCKSKIENSISLPLHLLHIDLFGPTFVKSLKKKMYCLVVTDDYSRFTWLFFLTTKDETSGILKSFITRIENLVDHKVKVIRCDNGTEFKNREINQFCKIKGILRQYSLARTPQQNGVAERRNRTLIEATRTMLCHSKLPTTFWAEAFNTACYVQNRVLVVKPHNKTPYEHFHGRTPTLSFMRPFRCLVTILNTIDHLDKFDGKADEGFFVGYSLNSKAFRVFNSRTRIVKENFHIRFNESIPNVVGRGPDWLFNIDALTRTMNYEPIIIGIQPNGFVGIKASDNAGQARKETEPVKDHILLPLWTDDLPFSQDPKSSYDDGSKPSSDDGKKVDEDPIKESKFKDQENIELPFDQNMPALEDDNIFDFSRDDEDDGAMAEMNNLDTRIQVSPNLTTRIHKDHPFDQVIGDLQSATQTRKMSKILEEHGIEAIRLFLAYASFKDFVVYQMDVKSVFLYGKIEEEVYVCQPPGFEDPNFPDRVYKVEKALYGLHQAPRAWCIDLINYRKWKYPLISRYLLHSIIYICSPGFVSSAALSFPAADHNLWDIIVNGDLEDEATPSGEQSSPPIPKTTKQLAARRNQEMIKSILLLAIPNEYLLKFYNVPDAKSLWAAIKSRFGGNEESKKMQKNVLKHQFENFVTVSNETLDKAYDRFQKLISQLEIHGDYVSKEDINQKFLRSLPPSWSQIALIMRNKPDIDEVDIDDLYNHLRVYEDELKRSSGSNSASQYLSFLSFENTNSTNEVSTGSGEFGVNTVGGINQVPYTPSAHDIAYSFLAQPTTNPQLENENFQQMDGDDLEELDL
ncbi:putative ribonuclease H-like domain-containing protein [Tanacetum coccineum]